jgi:hypothetical protein
VDALAELSVSFGAVAWKVHLPTLAAVAIAVAFGLAVVLVAFVESA